MWALASPFVFVQQDRGCKACVAKNYLFAVLFTIQRGSNLA